MSPTFPVNSLFIAVQMFPEMYENLINIDYMIKHVIQRNINSSHCNFNVKKIIETDQKDGITIHNMKKNIKEVKKKIDATLF